MQNVSDGDAVMGFFVPMFVLYEMETRLQEVQGEVDRQQILLYDVMDMVVNRSGTSEGLWILALLWIWGVCVFMLVRETRVRTVVACEDAGVKV